MRCNSPARSRTRVWFGHGSQVVQGIQGVQGIQVNCLDTLDHLDHLDSLDTLDNLDSLDNLENHSQNNGPRLTLRRGQPSSRRPLAVSSTGPIGVAIPNEAPQPAM